VSVFYLVVKNVRRATGRSVIGAAAYCARAQLLGGSEKSEYDFSWAPGHVHSELFLNRGAPGAWEDRSALWNEVEAVKEAPDETVALEVEAVIPDVVLEKDGVSAARELVVSELIPWGWSVDLNVHRAVAADGEERLFAYALLPLKWSSYEGWGRDRTHWRVGPRIIKEWRLSWARLVNAHLMKAKSLEKIGTKVGETRGRGFDVDLPVGVSAGTVYEQKWRHGERLLAEPELLLQRLTQEKRTFEWRELVTSVRDLTASEEQYSEALFRVQSLPRVVKLGVNEKGEELFSVRGEACPTDRRKGESELIRENRTDDEYAYSMHMKGRSYTALKVAVAGWASEGLRVRGIGLTFERAKKFEKASGIVTVAVHGILGRWKKKQDRLESNDVLVVNEIRALSDAQKNWILKAVRRQKAKLVVMLDEEFVVIEGTTIGLDQRQTAAMGW